MHLKSKVAFWLLGATVSVCLAAPVRGGEPAKGTAVVVGVDRYSGLEPAAQLRGCVNDARSIGEKLKGYGLDVVVLTNPAKQEIVSALAEARAKNTRETPFVFVFAGHGTSDETGSGYILPADTESAGTAHDIGAAELERLVAAVPASRRTVILDSCFSGAMMRSAKKQGSEFRTRFYSKAGGAARADGSQGGFRNSGSEQVSLSGRAGKSLVRVATTADTSVASPVCYFVAAKPTEQAGENRLDGQRHGIFTFYLLQHLTGAALRGSDLQTQVTGDVAAHTADQQHPELTPAFRGLDFLGLGNAAKTEPPAPSLWDAYNTDNQNRSAIRLSLQPDQATNKQGEQLVLKATAGEAGYLVVLERGTSGEINLIYPDEKPEAIAVRAGDTIELGTFVADAEGDERIKAILFTAPEPAQALVEAFPPPDAQGRRSLPVLNARSRSLRKVRNPATNAFYTDDIHFEVVP